MRAELKLALPPSVASTREGLLATAAAAAGVAAGDITDFRVLHRSIDARRKPIIVNLRVEIATDGRPLATGQEAFRYPDVSGARTVLIVGAGPAGLFAALRLIELGARPVIVERGQDVSARKRDIAKLLREHLLDTESNYCFGEGGAGAFSDGKLYTRSKKRGDNARALARLRFHGAAEDITCEAHPHIGSDKLPAIITSMRDTIRGAGGEIRFGARVTGLAVRDNAVKGVRLSSGETLESPAVILATGHSAHDVYEMLQRQKILLEAKAFAMGVRVEHPQALINAIQYHRDTAQIPWLPPASYALAHTAAGRGVYSFCMCPGGFIVPTATAPNAIVVNGMSPSLRNTPFANAGLVVEIRLDDFADGDALAGLRFQQALEGLAAQHSDGGLAAPAQRVTDFMDGRASRDLPESSYLPGLCASALHTWLPRHIAARLGEGVAAFDRRMRGFLTREAVLVGVETRTSSPVRIPRDRATCQHVQVRGLYPCGEGAGYAGGILSSAIDGENCAEAVARDWGLPACG